jgi:hypothetical protein
MDTASTDTDTETDDDNTAHSSRSDRTARAAEWYARRANADSLRDQLDAERTPIPLAPVMIPREPRSPLDPPEYEVIGYAPEPPMYSPGLPL